jgi:uncharacterized protein (DUF1778 family)
MARKTDFLQIRVSRNQKAAIRRHAREAGMDLSSYVLARAVPATREHFNSLLKALATTDDHSFPLAHLNDLLSDLSPAELREAVAHADLNGLSSFLANYVAAMVELACRRCGINTPEWTADVPPLNSPWFASDLPGLRGHLLASSPVPFRRRNIFVDASIGARV